MNHDQIYSNPHFAARVKRYHTWPMLHQQTVGEHVCQLMRIWWQIWGPLPSAISTHLIWHDMGELYTGDMPNPIKNRFPDVKLRLDAAEEGAVRAMGGPQIPAPLSTEDCTRVKICDLLDLWESGLVELLQGNKLAGPIVKLIEPQIEALASSLSGGGHRVTVYMRKVEEMLE